MSSTDDRLARLLAEHGDASVAIDAVTMITAPYARRASASNDAVPGLSSILDSLARWSSERSHHDTHQKENDDELD